MADVLHVCLIHGDDEIEFFQILLHDAACFSADGVALAAQGLAHSGVRGISLMVADGTCGIDDEVVIPACIRHLLPENNLCCRGAADVSHAYE